MTTFLNLQKRHENWKICKRLWIKSKKCIFAHLFRIFSTFFMFFCSFWRLKSGHFINSCVKSERVINVPLKWSSLNWYQFSNWPAIRFFLISSQSVFGQRTAHGINGFLPMNPLADLTSIVPWTYISHLMQSVIVPQSGHLFMQQLTSIDSDSAMLDQALHAGLQILALSEIDPAPPPLWMGSF